MSFAAEMKDFVGAWTTVNEMGVNKKKLDLQKQEIDNLKQYRDASMELNREQLDLARTNADRNFSLAKERNAISREAAEAAKMNGIFESLGDVEQQSFDWSTEGGQGAVDPNAEAYAIQARGGMVARAAEGGVIEEIEEDPDLPFVDPNNPYVDPELNKRVRVRRAIPVDAPAASAAPAEQPSYDAMGNATGTTEVNPEASAKITNDAQAAVAAAAPSLVEDAKKPEAAVGPEAEQERMDIVNNRGGLSMDEYKELISTIDPNNSIPSYLKSAAVLASTHRYFTENGQPEKAQRIAKGILILNKQMTQTLGALAQNAMEEGDVPAAARLVSDAANQFPTGDQFKVNVTENGLTYTRMQNGKEAGSGELTTEQLWELTGKVKDGSLYIEEMGRLAQAGGSGKVGKTQALELTADAYASAIQAKEALDIATEEGVDEKELNALRDKARQAISVYQRFRSNSLSMGIKRTDIDAANRDAEEMAIPMAEQPEDSLLSAQEAGVTSDGNTVEFDEMPAPKTQADRDALPPGTKYVAPDGSIRTR